jgi:flagellar M-ring protein FliF
MTEQTQESFNPDAPALRSDQTVEELTMGSMEGGIPGALSNQPPGAATAPETVNGEGINGANGNNGEGTPSRNHRRAIRNFELDKTISHTRTSMGRLHRLSVAVVVDDKLSINEAGEELRLPRTPEELTRLTELVKKAVGFNAQRGDTVNVMNSSFTVPPAPEPLPEVPVWEQAWAQDLLKKILGAGLVLVLFFGVLKPVMRSLAKQAEVTQAAAIKAAGEEEALAEDKLSIAQGEALPALGGPGNYEQNMATANRAVEQDPKLVAQVVKNWVTADGG